MSISSYAMKNHIMILSMPIMQWIPIHIGPLTTNIASEYKDGGVPEMAVPADTGTYLVYWNNIPYKYSTRTWLKQAKMIYRQVWG